MPRFHHGCAFSQNDGATETAVVTPTAHASAAAQPATSAAAQPAPNETRFDFLFPDLQDGAFLTPGADTVALLIALGMTMDDTKEENALDSTLPAIFTYFGQIIAHDITWEKGTPDITSLTELKPWTPDKVTAIVNKRSGSLDLDCIYGDATFEVPLTPTGTLLIDRVAQSAGHIPNKSDLNDVPRVNSFLSPDFRAPRIGDPRNDANTIISQLHVAFLLAHNKLMESGDFADARTKLVRLYQTIVVEDYLTRIIQPGVLAMFRAKPDLLHKKPFMPVEFSSAAFRFGHTMIRASYDLNRNFKGNAGGKMHLLMMLGMPPGHYHHLPEGWVIEWEHFVDEGSNAARRITTQMVEPLSLLKDSADNPFKNQLSLAVRDLLRGYVFRLPTGQAVAEAVGVEQQEVLTADDFKRLVPAAQFDILSNSEFLEKTPLWFYILAEAAREKERVSDHDYLGPVGSRLVGGVLMGLLFRSKNSVLQNGNSPLGNTLSDLLRLGGVL